MATLKELEHKRSELATKAREIVDDENATADKVEQAKRMYADITRLGEQIALKNNLADVGEYQRAAKNVQEQKHERKTWHSRPEFLKAVVAAGSSRQRFQVDPRLMGFSDKSEPAVRRVGADGETAWEGKALSEGTGADGGFLVPPEFSDELLSIDPEMQPIRNRANVIPMARRQINIPVLDQTGSTSGQPAWFGGLIAYWSEEAAQKTESSPKFRQASLVAHKLICYTRASDELLGDSIISLDAWLQSDMGFAGAIRWYSERAFLQGTGAGQPQGVITAVNEPTIEIARAADGITVDNLTDMLEAHMGPDPVWHISRGQYSNLMQLNGPASNPSYIFIPNGRDGAPATLFGFPIIWDDKLPAPNSAGDVLLASWRYYVIGDRQVVTFRSTDIERFQYDQTSFRAVSRLDGMPWMSAPITYQDGTTTVSPFVILGASSAS